MEREKIIIRTSILGIIANVLLSGFKAVVGLLSRSVAIVLDSVNNLTDAISSIVTIIGTKIAGRAPDRKHPLGHGRVEYLSAMIIAVIILYAGVTALVESIKKIITPEAPDYAPVTLIVVGVAVAVKVVLGLYVRKTGKKVKSETLVGSGTDALFDAIISASTLLAAAIFLIFGINLEAWLGAIISVFILKTGIEMLISATGEILGKRIDPAIAKDVREVVASFPEVQGVFDLVIHNYGPEKLYGSVHIAVSEDMNAEELDVLERKIAGKVYMDTQVAMTGISVYAVDEKKDLSRAVEAHIRTILEEYPQILEMHGFHLFEEEHVIQFDVVLDFTVKRRDLMHQELLEKVKAAYPDYQAYITLDSDIS
ncbi:MAG: cation transporter [Lachnospiraceae bacterium]|nr:cation transporter [Lachnospiraceae bacterium]